MILKKSASFYVSDKKCEEEAVQEEQVDMRNEALALCQFDKYIISRCVITG